MVTPHLATGVAVLPSPKLLFISFAVKVYTNLALAEDEGDSTKRSLSSPQPTSNKLLAIASDNIPRVMMGLFIIEVLDKTMIAILSSNNAKNCLNSLARDKCSFIEII